MAKRAKLSLALLLVALCALPAAGRGKKKAGNEGDEFNGSIAAVSCGEKNAGRQAPASHEASSPTQAGVTFAPGACVLWRDPGDIGQRDLFFGPGGREHEPHGPFTFVKEDLDGTSPKFVVRDPQGVEWKVKLGVESRPETAADRLVWAAGYYTNEDYLVPHLRVEQMPARLTRGQNFVDPGGSLREARLKRYLEGEKKIGNWAWMDDPFKDTREWNGLRVLMALINNWDLKDENNSVYREKGGEGSEFEFMISDLGASFGTATPAWPISRSKGNLHSYEHSKFITRVGPEDVDFRTPGRPSRFYGLIRRREYNDRKNLAGIGLHVPREDALWIGRILARLSDAQVRDAFRAGGYSPKEAQEYARVVERRIAALAAL